MFLKKKLLMPIWQEIFSRNNNLQNIQYLESNLTNEIGFFFGI